MGKRHDRRSREGLTREAGIRGQRLEEIFREELSSILDTEVTDRALEGSRVTRVELSPDGSRARVWVAFDRDRAVEARAVERAFTRATGFIRTRLCDVLPLKRIPELRFRLDPAVADVADILEKD